MIDWNILGVLILLLFGDRYLHPPILWERTQFSRSQPRFPRDLLLPVLPHTQYDQPPL